MLRQQQIGRHHQQQHAAGGAERWQADADQPEQLDAAEREGEQHDRRHSRSRERQHPPVLRA